MSGLLTICPEPAILVPFVWMSALACWLQMIALNRGPLADLFGSYSCLPFRTGQTHQKRLDLLWVSMNGEISAAMFVLFAGTAKTGFVASDLGAHAPDSCLAGVDPSSWDWSQT